MFGTEEWEGVSFGFTFYDELNSKLFLCLFVKLIIIISLAVNWTQVFQCIHFSSKMKYGTKKRASELNQNEEHKHGWMWNEAKITLEMQNQQQLFSHFMSNENLPFSVHLFHLWALHPPSDIRCQDPWWILK